MNDFKEGGNIVILLIKTRWSRLEERLLRIQMPFLWGELMHSPKGQHMATRTVSVFGFSWLQALW